MYFMKKAHIKECVLFLKGELMNLCIVYGKIISEIKFDFIYKSKHISISTFYIKLSNNSIIQIKAYDDLADFTYSKLKKEDIIVVKGKLGKNQITAEEIANRDGGFWQSFCAMFHNF